MLRGWGFRGTPSTSLFKGYIGAVGGRSTPQAIARRGAQSATRPRGCGGGGEPPPRLPTRTRYGHLAGEGASERSERAERSEAERGWEAMRSRVPFGLAQNRMPAADADPNRQCRLSINPRLLCLAFCNDCPFALHLQDMQTRENGWRYR